MKGLLEIEKKAQRQAHTHTPPRGASGKSANEVAKLRQSAEPKPKPNPLLLTPSSTAGAAIS
jgi:hypothetical protein